MLKLGLFFGQQALQRLPLDRIGFARKQLPEVRDIQVRNRFVQGQPLTKERPAKAPATWRWIRSILIYISLIGVGFPPQTTVMFGGENQMKSRIVAVCFRVDRLCR